MGLRHLCLNQLQPPSPPRRVERRVGHGKLAGVDVSGAGVEDPTRPRRQCAGVGGRPLNANILRRASTFVDDVDLGKSAKSFDFKKKGKYARSVDKKNYEIMSNCFSGCCVAQARRKANLSFNGRLRAFLLIFQHRRKQIRRRGHQHFSHTFPPKKITAVASAQIAAASNLEETQSRCFLGRLGSFSLEISTPVKTSPTAKSIKLLQYVPV